MRGYERDEYENLDEYEEDGEEEDDGEEEYEEEETQQPSHELLEYLELRQRLKEDIRKQMKKGSGSANAGSRVIKSVMPRDNYGSFFGPSQPVIAQRVIQESKSLLENPNLAVKVMKSSHSSTKSAAPRPAGLKSATSSHASKVTNGLKTKIQVLKNTRDYSFLLSDDSELPVPSKSPLPPKVSAPNSDTRFVRPPRDKQYSSNTSSKPLNDREVKKPLPGSSQTKPKAMYQKMVSISKPTQPTLDSRKQLGSSNGSGPGRPLGPKGVPPKVTGGSNEKKLLRPVVKSTVPALHKPAPSKSQASVPRQSILQNKRPVESGKAEMMSKQAVHFSKPQAGIQKQAAASSSRPQIKQPPTKSVARSLESRPPARKATRYGDEDPDDPISMIRQLMGYNPSKYRNESDDDSDMEANFDDILKEERRSAKIAKKEDEEELRKIEEEERRERLRKQAKRRKLSQQ